MVSAERISDEPEWRPLRAVDDAGSEPVSEGEGGPLGSPRAGSSLLVRIARITVGSLVSLLGLVLIPLPGPGLFVLGAGLSILAIDVPPARRLLAKVRARMPQDADGATPKWLLALMGGAAAIGAASSVAFLLA